MGISVYGESRQGLVNVHITCLSEMARLKEAHCERGQSINSTYKGEEEERKREESNRRRRRERERKRREEEREKTKEDRGEKMPQPGCSKCQRVAAHCVYLCQEGHLHTDLPGQVVLLNTDLPRNIVFLCHTLIFLFNLHTDLPGQVVFIYIQTDLPRKFDYFAIPVRSYFPTHRSAVWIVLLDQKIYLPRPVILIYLITDLLKFIVLLYLRTDLPRQVVLINIHNDLT